MNNDNNFKNFFKKNGFSVAICSVIAIVIVATIYLSYNNFDNGKQNQIVKNDETEFQPVNKTNVKSYKEISTETTSKENISKANPEEKKPQDIKYNQQSNQENKANEKTVEPTKLKDPNTQDDTKKGSEENKVFSLFDESKEMSWPVSGQIVMDYSMETSIYDKTLKEYRTNDSIAISAPKGTDVTASAEGIVEDIFANKERGNTVVINHGNGWLSTYSQLEDDISVAVGEVVKEGQFLGKIGSPSNYSVLLGPHLEFKITKDEVASDPKLVLAQIEE